MYEIHIEFHVLKEFSSIFFLNPLDGTLLKYNIFLQLKLNGLCLKNLP